MLQGNSHALLSALGKQSQAEIDNWYGQSNDNEAMYIGNSITKRPIPISHESGVIVRKETGMKPTQLDSSGLMFSIKKRDQEHFKNRRRKVDKDNNGKRDTLVQYESLKSNFLVKFAYHLNYRASGTILT